MIAVVVVDECQLNTFHGITTNTVDRDFLLFHVGSFKIDFLVTFHVCAQFALHLGPSQKDTMHYNVTKVFMLLKLKRG